MNLQAAIALAIANLLFGAGGAWFLLKMTRKEVAEGRRELNGVGAKVRELQALQIAAEPESAERVRLVDRFFGVKK